jgi:hypothetical protein
VYVARYGWNGRSGGLIIGVAVFVLIALTAPMSLALRVITLVLFGGGALVFIASIATHRVALRVDASGIALGGSPGRYRSTSRLIRGPTSGKWCSGASRCPTAVRCGTWPWPAIEAPRRWPGAAASGPAR